METQFIKALKKGDLSGMVVLLRMVEGKSRSQRNTAMMVVFGRKKDRSHLKKEFERRTEMFKRANQALAYMTNMPMFL